MHRALCVLGLLAALCELSPFGFLDLHLLNREGKLKKQASPEKLII